MYDSGIQSIPFFIIMCVLCI